ncbi:efflux RND transporter periplasmic adaptor subunit [Parabacteroides sp. PF5-9]|uniref:efflux RND transporter periplasmic adaptor subunit n=1 Tax=Parabacteroides sp. PF5-9 TaxID=1742404 RepID=UPI0024757FC6|nr:efflux RND transporter periplasmic adaptor subunit [Parabacteroides sp. PF5-9]MDH6358054.1 RND family efflux transporter MFP subunit [Parabacteroides sp. PF5-9]
MNTKPALLFVLSLSLFACGNKEQNTGNNVREIAVISVQPSSTELISSYSATIKGKQDIEIRPKVAGFITELKVDEGSVVRKGQTLFVIDPVPYQAALQVAEANVQVAETSVQTSQLTFNNKRQLREQNIISDYELQMAENDLATRKAQLAQAKAQLINARNDLSYTNVVSPSNGIVGTIPYRIGSLVSSATAVPLTVVSDISEMFVYFSMTEKQILSLIRGGGNMQEILDKMPEVQLQLSDGSIYGEKGKIETLSGVIEQSTGTATIRATFPNANNILRSGGAGTVLLPYREEQAILVPQTATYEIQDKKFVYVLSEGSVVKSREIEIYPSNDGKSYIVTAGLKAGDQIAVEGISTLRDGTPIKPISPEESAARIKAMQQGAQQGQNN